MNELDIFSAAIELADLPARAKFLDEACSGRPDLRSRIDALLRNADDASRYLEASPQAILDTLDRPTAENIIAEHVGAQIGPYKLLEQIGEGGMGIVYVAEQTQPVRRRVALKIIKPGMDTKQVIARFEAERQALAMMDHPHIAKILDAGTTEVGPGRRTGPDKQSDVASLALPTSPSPSSGRPYFVMELVRGMPVTEYCDQERLKPQQRLELIIDVCHAVQHAHQKGIIHRDLKPSNVMVTLHDGVPVVKVIDFGVAKAVGQQLTDRTIYTGLTQLVGTPLYMSPEQAELSGLDIDTRSDVYSLGVLLYELLTGTTPFDKERLKNAGFDEMRRMIREDEPPRPSTRMSTLGAEVLSTISQRRSTDPRRISATLRGEIDWIVMKSLEKDRSRRYESASALAADIQRYLSDEPVLACPPTTMYRFHKFARKHKASLTTAAAVALCLLLGTTVSAWQALRATTAEAQAVANEQKAVANEHKATANAVQAEEKAQEAATERDEAQKQRDEVKALVDKLAAKEDELQRTLYADHIHMAKDAWDSGNVSRVSSLLSQHLPKAQEPDRRGFEWYYLNRLSHIGPLFSIDTPRLQPQEFTLSPDRTRVIRFRPAPTRLDRTQFSPGAVAERVAELIRSNAIKKGESGPDGPSLQVWNLKTGKEELMTPLVGAPDRIVYGREAAPIFSPDATRMAITTSRFDFNSQDHVAGELKVWDTQTGRVVLLQSGVVGKEVVFSSDSKLLVSVMENKSVKLWDMETGQERLTLQGQVEPVYLFAFDRGCKRLAAASHTWDKDKKTAVACEIKIWNVQTGQQEQTLKGDWESVGALVFSPDGQRLASGAEETGTIKLWNSHTGNELMTLQSGCEYFWNLTFNADGTRLLACGEKEVGDDSVYSAKLWNALAGEQIVSFQVADVEFSPDGKRVAMADRVNKRTKVFDAQTGQIMLSVADAGGKLAFSTDSRRLATQSGGMRIWDLETGDQINHIKGFAGTAILAFSSDGKRLIGGSAQEIQIWDVDVEQQSGTTLTLAGVNRQQGHRRGSSSAAVSADFTRIAGISYRAIKIFDARTGQELRTLPGHEKNVTCVALSPDGKCLASTDGQSYVPPGTPNTGVVKVWNSETGSLLFSITDLNPSVVHLAFSPDGNKLAGSSGDHTIRLWDVNSGSELHTFKSTSANRDTFTMFAFSPDSKRIAGTGKIWDVATGQELVTLDRAKDAMAFSPDGKRVVGADTPFSHSVWDVETGKPIYTIPAGNMAYATFSPDGKRLVTPGAIWDAQTGQGMFSLGGHMSGQVAFSPDGYRLAVVKAMSNEVTIYDATPLPEKP